MTREFTDRPVWTWYCDRCLISSGDLAWRQDQLPTPDEMRERGWHIAPLSGDLCPSCVKERGAARTDASTSSIHSDTERGNA